MKLALSYLALVLQVWFGVSAIIMGLCLLGSSLATDFVPSQFQQCAGFLFATLGALIIIDAVRRELKVHVIESMEKFGNPLDSPTQA
jgi:protein-S-isoprenylcysteine O-methyltransferase Ste14